MNPASFLHVTYDEVHCPHQSRYNSRQHDQDSWTCQPPITYETAPPSIYPPRQIANCSVQGSIYSESEMVDPAQSAKIARQSNQCSARGSDHSSPIAQSASLSILPKSPQAPSEHRTSRPEIEFGSFSVLHGANVKFRCQGYELQRLNHLKSEQKRRDYTRECYLKLITLLAPEDGGPMLKMPTRGRPKGCTAKNKNKVRGKSAIIFRTVEFTKWLEDGNEALRVEVERLEAAANHSDNFYTT